MLFNKNIEKCCAVCQRATLLINSEKIMCKKKGVVEADYKCRKFKYDPFKREPKKQNAQMLEGYTKEDFEI
ncbi:MAG: hypothetical protein E7480_00170 [Ruminococcaceae bacterium]|nr:hypothetical protein [Oscillospiraceae bacterium]